MDDSLTRDADAIALVSIPARSHQNTMNTSVDNSSNLSSQTRQRHSHNPTVDDHQPPTQSLTNIVNRFINTPLMGVLSALVCFCGALEPFSYFSAKSTVTKELKNVFPIYAPAPFYTWLLAVNTLMYDAATATAPAQGQGGSQSTSPWFDKARLAGVLLYGFFAVVEHLVRSAMGQTDPSQAAARYVADKAFESTGILFAIIEWKKFRNVRKNEAKTLPHAGNPETTHGYLHWLPWIFVLAFSVGRALEQHIDRYVIPLKSEHYKMSWDPVIPKEWRPISLVIGLAFGLLSSRGSLKRRCEKGWIKVVWMSNVILHSGLFGTLGPLRLTDKDPRAIGQWLPFVFVVVGTCVQYWRDLVKFPAAARKRLTYMFKWHAD